MKKWSLFCIMLIVVFGLLVVSPSISIAKDIKVGFIDGYSGPPAVYSNDVVDAFKMEVDKVNAAGGLYPGEGSPFRGTMHLDQGGKEMVVGNRLGITPLFSNLVGLVKDGSDLCLVVRRHPLQQRRDIATGKCLFRLRDYRTVDRVTVCRGGSDKAKVDSGCQRHRVNRIAYRLFHSILLSDLLSNWLRNVRQSEIRLLRRTSWGDKLRRKAPRVVRLPVFVPSAR